MAGSLRMIRNELQQRKLAGYEFQERFSAPANVRRGGFVSTDPNWQANFRVLLDGWVADLSAEIQRVESELASRPRGRRRVRGRAKPA